MTPFIKKEFRLLLPSWLVVLALEVAQPWFVQDQDTAICFAPVFFFFGLILLAVDSFGREFSQGTFLSLLSQPIERRQIWRTKITFLFLGAGLIFIAYFASCYLRLHLALADKDSVWHGNSVIIGRDFQNAMLGSVAALLVALAGGLWTTVLFRQISAAFWITFLTPWGLMLLIAFGMDKFCHNVSDQVAVSLLYGFAVIYSVAGFWLAHRLFHRAQDVAWTGGIISFSKWRYFEAGDQRSTSVRQHKPFAALLKKEFQLQSISLFCAAVLLALHLAIIVMRLVHGHFERDSLVSVGMEFFWSLWLVLPLIIGSLTVAEERKLGVVEEQFCLPVSRQFQFAVKWLPAMVIGTVLGGVFPLLLENMASALGAPNEFFHLENHSNLGFGYIPGQICFVISILALAAALALVGFFASTLARNFLQALSIAMLIFVGAGLGFQGFSELAKQQFAADQSGHILLAVVQFCGVILPVVLGILAIIITIPLLAFRNFSSYVETRRLWRRNLLGILGAILVVFASSAVIHNRVWEVFQPAEAAHGPAMFSAANRPVLRCSRGDLQVSLPDGRIWCQSLSYPYFDETKSKWHWLWWALLRPMPVGSGPEQFIAGSNWVSAATMRAGFWNSFGGPREVKGYLDTVGVQADGSLWISREAKPATWTGADMVRFGPESNWRQVARSGVGLLLLKQDGTLWQWGTSRLDWSRWQSNWPTVRASQPQQLGTNADWQDLFHWNLCLARKQDGSTWQVNWDWKLERATYFDHVNLGTFSDVGNNAAAYIGDGGALWVSSRRFEAHDHEGTRKFLPVGKETNWVATAMSWNWLVALKADGSLWQWQARRDLASDMDKITPVPLGIHRDWIGLTSAWDGIVTLAADGSLWFWPDPQFYLGALLTAPKQPQAVGQVFRPVN
ncbi:MAG: hypothetical protein WCS94_11965 [Verrucomicrobiota bacterium]